MTNIQSRTRKKIPTLAAIALMTALTSSVVPIQSVEAAPSTFNSLSEKNDIHGLWTYIEDHADSGAPASVTVWLRRLEALQQKRVAGLEQALSQESVQQALMEKDGIYGDWKRGTRTGNAQADKLLIEIEKNGYVLDSTEGYFFPKIDYLRYMKYAPYTTSRYASYLKIRSDETKSELTKDAGLIVSWNELLNRAERQSRYLMLYPNSPETKVVDDLYRQSLHIVLYGTDNVPLFDETGHLDAYAKAAYLQQIKKGGNTPFAKMLAQYTALLQKNGWALNTKIENFRDARNPWELQ
ncbi:hypothetical protein [Saccharibacillus sp. JS10]|uniref:hypothetical protein n=1 Tax=Saccharibacillus sp. JS10 TaxID=2950552 RepID=UPI00210B5564|nr:hypothetical protein [Saccharibacillus sp. JS10]MCQ4087493.1 hypothetical protein [Saccharibacillus sp. JS10]